MANSDWVIVHEEGEVAEHAASPSPPASDSDNDDDSFDDEDDTNNEGMFDMFTGDVARQVDDSHTLDDIQDTEEPPEVMPVRSESGALDTIKVVPQVPQPSQLPLRQTAAQKPSKQQDDLRALNAQAHLPFEYESLTDPTYIRVFQILPAEAPGEPISLSMSTMMPTRCHYLALSYAWGASDLDRPHLTHTVPCDGRLLRITSNLYAALEVMRYHLDAGRWTMFGQRPYVWADAICIDQTSVAERNHQVCKMAEIYGKAAATSIWLGEATSGEDQALTQTVNVMRARVTQPGSGLATSPLCFTRDDMVKLLQRDWFQRRWVIQEFAVHKTRTILLGKAAMDFSSFLSLLNEYGLVQQAGPMRDVVQFDSFRPKRWLLTNLHLFREAECAESHDLVYALIHISCGCKWARSYSHCGVSTCGTDNYSIDYGVSVEELLISLAIQFLRRDYMAVLASACIRQAPPASAHGDRMFPSWVPDWRQLPQNSSTQLLEYVDRCFESPISKVHGEGFELPGDSQGWTSRNPWTGYITQYPEDIYSQLKVSGWIMQQPSASHAVEELPWTLVGQDIPGMKSVEEQHSLERDGPWIERPTNSRADYYAEIDRREPHYEVIFGHWPMLGPDDLIWFMWGRRLAFIIRRAGPTSFTLVAPILRPAPMRKTAFAWVDDHTDRIVAYGCVRRPPVEFFLD